MINHLKLPWGDGNVHRVYSDDGNFQMEVAENGAVLQNLILEGVALIDGYRSPYELEKHDWGRSEILAPFPNRLEDGKYSHEGKIYQFPVNEAATQTALHGHSMGLEYNLYRLELNEKKVSLHFSCQVASSPSYPFDYQINVQYTFNTNSRFRCQVTCEPLAIPPEHIRMPLGLGIHPYFTLPGALESWQLQLPEMELIEINDRMIPTGVQKSFQEFLDYASLEDRVLDNCFRLRNDADKMIIKLRHEDWEIAYSQGVEWLEKSGIKESKNGYVQLFTPPMRQSIAIEPMSCNINALNNKDGLVQMALGDRLDVWYEIQLLKRECL